MLHVPSDDGHEQRAATSYAIPIRLVLLIRSLELGGAQRQLVELATGLDRRRFDIAIVALYAGGHFWDDVRTIDGVRVLSAGKRHRWDFFGMLWRLGRIIAEQRPQVVHSYLGLSNILAVLAKLRWPRLRVIWSLRNARCGRTDPSRAERLIARVEAALSRYADLIISNSGAARAAAIDERFPAERIVVVPNGIDTARFVPAAPDAARNSRSALGLGGGERVVGIVARLDPLKDHPTLLAALRTVCERRADVRLVCVGDGPAAYVERLRAYAAQLGIAGRIVWAGARTDMPAVYAAFDVLCSSSLTEGFPNVVAEAMACGVPCVVTDVGDCARLVGDTGLVVPSGAPDLLADALLTMLDRVPSPVLSQRARARIVAEFGLDALAQRTAAALESVL